MSNEEKKKAEESSPVEESLKKELGEENSEKSDSQKDTLEQEVKDKSKESESTEKKSKKEQEEEEKKIREEERRKGKREHLYEESKGSWKPILIVMLISIAIAGLWNEVPVIKEAISSVLDPTAGDLLRWNLNWGMLIIAFVISFITTIAQKYGTDQETLKDLKAEQKDLQKEMKENKSNTDKMQELQKKQMKLMPNQMRLSMRAVAFTGVPFILLIRWFEDYFMGLESYDLWLGMGWFLFYLISLIVIGAILRKQMNVV